MDQTNTIELESGNKAACKRYYERNSFSAKKRVLLSDIKCKGRLPTEATLALRGVTVHEVIEAFRAHQQSIAPREPKKLMEFRILVGNML